MKRKGIRFPVLVWCILAPVFLSLFVTQVFIPTMNLPEYQKPDAKLKSIKDITDWISENEGLNYKYDDVNGDHTEVTYWFRSDTDMFMRVDYWVFNSVEEAEKDMMLKRPYFPHNYHLYNWNLDYRAPKTEVINYRGFEMQVVCWIVRPESCDTWFGVMQSKNKVLQFYQFYLFYQEDLEKMLDGFLEE